MNRQFPKNAGPLLTCALVATLAATPWISTASAGQRYGHATSATLTRNITMGVGRSMIVDLPADATEVFVGSPDIANAIVRSPRRIYIMAVKAGQTSIIAMDKQGNQIADLEISTGRNIEELGRILRMAIPGANIKLSTVNDTIIMSGEVENAIDAQQALDIAKGFVGTPSQGVANGGQDSGKVVSAITIKGRDQVMLKVLVSEVDRNVIKSLGITQAALQGSWATFGMSNPFTINSAAAAGASLLLSNNSGNRQALVNALERNSVGRVLAEPNVTAISGETAKFTAGGELPVPSGSNCPATSSGTSNLNNVCVVTFAYKPYGVTLNFTPIVLSKGRIQLHIATEVTEIDQSHQFLTSTGSIPAFTTRKNETTVELPSGGSIATAGLISTISHTAINGLPGLMNLPILGALFRSRDYLRDETELMITVTPYIVKPVPPKALSMPTDNLADASDPRSILLGQVNEIYSSANHQRRLSNYKGQVGFIND
ncbi:MAG: type II and III secretion system protein family protein [Hyphomicrobiales bacterium]|nr:type II and III secretion system protein family protein [Hyphomicrobiales bacterium]MDE2114382.1 type II and III secretion system protein family protein [Hyphomicrobiales bacterium]